MAADYKYDGESDDENEDDDYSCDSGISAIKFRKRLQQLQSQSKKLENLQLQLLSIKNASYITQLDKVCAISIIQNTIRNRNKKSKRHLAADYKVVFSVFTDTDTDRVFNAVYTNNNFQQLCHSFWKDTIEASNNSLICSYQLIETSYTLFRKTLNNKALILLMVNEHDTETVDSYRLLDILQSIIVDLCTSLQIAPKKEREKENESINAMIEIMQEVFGIYDNYEEVYPLSQSDFVTCMKLRIGIESIWKSETKKRLQSLFRNIVNTRRETEDMDIDANGINFDNFIGYFSLAFDGQRDTRYGYDGNGMERLSDWNDIKHAVNTSPLSRQNKRLREKENISASKYREKLNDIEKLINILEEVIIFTVILKDKEQLFWRKKILEHREFVRFYQDVILHEIIEENNKMKSKMDRLIKLNKFSKKVEFEENAWVNNNQHLLQIEQNYYELLKKQKHQQRTMKKCERLIKEKDDEIYRLKTQLINVAKKHSMTNIQTQNADLNERSNSNSALTNKLTRLKGEIAQRKLEIQNQLNKITQNINENKIKQDRR